MPRRASSIGQAVIGMWAPSYALALKHFCNMQTDIAYARAALHSYLLVRHRPIGLACLKT